MQSVCMLLLLDVSVKKLLSSGVSPDSSNADGLTALHQVSYVHLVRAIQRILRNF